MLRKKDTLADRLWRMRGVLAVLTVPLLVIGVFVLMVPGYVLFHCLTMQRPVLRSPASCSRPVTSYKGRGSLCCL